MRARRSRPGNGIIHPVHMSRTMLVHRRGHSPEEAANY
jgi:hypothetical protein